MSQIHSTHFLTRNPSFYFGENEITVNIVFTICHFLFSFLLEYFLGLIIL